MSEKMLDEISELKSSTVTISSIAELEKWVANWVGLLPPRCILLLSGQVGAGKTETVKAIVRALGDDEAYSPSYSIHNRYICREREIDHVDLYRLEDDDDLESTGFWEIFSQEQGLVIVEWSDRLAESVYPKNWKAFKIRLDVDEVSQNRTIAFSPL